jgi:predicted histone-like DNA-binding protein
MSVKFRTVRRKNLLDPNAPPKHYVIVHAQEVTDIDGLSGIISDKSTISRPDVYAVIIALLETIIKELMAGRSVNLGKLGSFSISVNSGGIENAEEVTAALIKKARVVYRPGMELKDMLKVLKYERS